MYYLDRYLRSVLYLLPLFLITFVLSITGIGLGSINSFGSKTDQAQRTNGNVLVAKGQTTKQWYHPTTAITAAARNHA